MLQTNESSAIEKIIISLKMQKHIEERAAAAAVLLFLLLLHATGIQCGSEMLRNSFHLLYRRPTDCQPLSLVVLVLVLMLAALGRCAVFYHFIAPLSRYSQAFTRMLPTYYFVDPNFMSSRRCLFGNIFSLWLKPLFAHFSSCA